MTDFTRQFPHLAWWAENQGWLELGADDYSGGLLRLLDSGGMYFEYTASNSLDFALAAGEEFLKGELAKRFLLRFDPATGDFEEITE